MAQPQVYSNYKSDNTVKDLIGITPAVAVSFLSYGWGGHVSGKMITLNSGFLEMVSHGDCILADCGFLIEEELATHGAVLRIPALTQGKKQLTARDVNISQQIPHIQIYTC